MVIIKTLSTSFSASNSYRQISLAENNTNKKRLSKYCHIQFKYRSLEITNLTFFQGVRHWLRLTVKASKKEESRKRIKIRFSTVLRSIKPQLPLSYLLEVRHIQIETGEIFADVDGGERSFSVFCGKVDDTRSKSQLDLDQSLVAIGQKVFRLSRIDPHNAEQQVAGCSQRQLQLKTPA